MLLPTIRRLDAWCIQVLDNEIIANANTVKVLLKTNSRDHSVLYTELVNRGH